MLANGPTCTVRTKMNRACAVRNKKICAHPALAITVIPTLRLTCAADPFPVAFTTMDDEPITDAFQRDPAPVTRVWRIPPVQLDDGAVDVLSSAERERAARIASPDARATFVRTRVALRSLMGTPAAQREPITLSPRGKPLLPPEMGLHLSISHTGRHAVIAVAPVPVGVDIEHVRLPRHYRRVCDRILHPSTTAVLDRARDDVRAVLFTDAWTQREAHVKAVGGGLFRTPDTLPFAAAASADGDVRTVLDGRDGAPWSLCRFAFAPGVRGTVAAAGMIESVIFMEWRMDG